jgi:hypothetical protein
MVARPLGICPSRRLPTAGASSTAMWLLLGFCRRMYCAQYPRFSRDAPTLGRCCFQSGPGCCRFLCQRCAGGGSPLEADWRVMVLSEPRISHTSNPQAPEAFGIRVAG